MPERKPPPQAEMDVVYRALFEHGPDVRVAALAAALGRRHRGATGRTLRAESADMSTTHAYWRVYWGGAAFAFARVPGAGSEDD